MNSLYIDTCTGELLVAIKTDNETKVFDKLTAKKTSEMMFPVIEDLLKESNITLKDIDNIYVTKGPGSYTGSRLGLTFAKVLKVLNPNLKVFTCSTLQALLASSNDKCIALIDARNQAYFASTKIEDEEECARLELEELIDLFKTYKPICYHLDENTLTNLKEYNVKGVSIIEGMLNNESIFNQISNVNDIKPFYLKGHGRE